MARATDELGWGAASPARRRLVLLLLSVPVLAMLAVPLYSRAEPALAGVPFFYWAQFAGVPLSILAMTLALRLLERPAGGRGARGRGGQQHL